MELKFIVYFDNDIAAGYNFLTYLKNICYTDSEIVKLLDGTGNIISCKLRKCNRPISNLQELQEENSIYFLMPKTFVLNMLDIKQIESDSTHYFCLLNKPKPLGEIDTFTIQDAINHECKVVYIDEDTSLQDADDNILVVDSKDYIVTHKQILKLVSNMLIQR